MAANRIEGTNNVPDDTQSNLSQSNLPVPPPINIRSSQYHDSFPNRFPRYKKLRLENSLLGDLSSVLQTDNLSDLRSFASHLAPTAHAVIERQREGPGRPYFHNEVARRTANDFFGEQWVLYETESDRSLFKLLLDASSTRSDQMTETTLYVLATLFVLTGPRMFTRPKALKLLTQILGSIPTHETDIIDEIHSLTRKCLIWSFSRLIEWEILEDVIWRNAVQVVEPFLDVGDVPHLVTYLVNRESHPNSRECKFPGAKLATMVVHTIMKRRQDDRSRIVTFDVLRQLLCSGCSEVWPSASLSLDCLLHIEGLLDDKPSDHGWEPEHEPTILRELSLDEISATWNILASAWHFFVQKEVDRASLQHINDAELSYDLVEMWRTLLQASGTQTSFLESLCRVHVSLVFNAAKQRSESCHLRTQHSDIQSLQATLQLWLVAVEELDIAMRTLVAQYILLRLFERRSLFVSFSGNAEKVWYKLIEEFVFCNPQKALTALENIRVSGDSRTLVQQQTWSDLVHYVVIPDVEHRGFQTSFSVNELVEFLRFPYKVKFQNMDEYVHLLWDTLLSQTWSIAHERRRWSIVLDLVDEISDERGVAGIRREEWMEIENTSKERTRPIWVARGRRREKVR